MNSSDESKMESSEGLLDANVFIHAQSTDQFSDECRESLDALQRGESAARLEVVVLHELTYVLPRYLKLMSRRDIARYLVSVLEWPGVNADKGILRDTLERWGSTPGLGFTDAHLAALAAVRQCPVYSKNVRELRAQGATVPDPLLAI